MNQILVSEKLYITPELKRKKRMYKIDFFISNFLVCILFSYYIYAEYDKNKNEAISQEILSSLTFEDNVTDDTTIKFSNNSIVVILNTEDNINWLRTESVTEYYIVATVNIPSINCTYPIINQSTDELLKIAPCKFWGPEPNEVGNFCIVGHNYIIDKLFSNLTELEIVDEI